jgi:hypothetical protein
MLRHYKTRVCAQNTPVPLLSHININSHPNNPRSLKKFRIGILVFGGKGKFLLSGNGNTYTSKESALAVFVVEKFKFICSSCHEK